MLANTQQTMNEKKLKKQNLSSIFQRLFAKYGKTQVTKPQVGALPQSGTPADYINKISALNKQLDAMQRK